MTRSRRPSSRAGVPHECRSAGRARAATGAALALCPALCVALCLAAQPLHARTGGGSVQSVRLTADAHMGADWNGGRTSPGQPSGTTAGATVLLSHARTGRRLTFTFTAGSEVRRRPGADGVTADGQRAAARLNVTLSPRTVVTAGQQLSYAPALSQPTGATAAGGPQLLASVRGSSDVTLTRTISRLTSVDAGIRADRTGFRGTDSRSASLGAEIGAARQLRRWAVVGVRYDGLRAEVAGGGSAASLVAHDTAAYVTLTPWRAARTAVAVTVAPVLAHRAMSARGTTTAPPPSGRSWLLTGRARLDRQAARTWTVGLEAGRRASYQAGLSEPVLMTALGASLSGTMGRDVGVTAAAGYSAGSGSDPSARVIAVTGHGRVAWRLSPAASAFVEVRHDASSTAAALTRIPGLAGRAHRTVFRLGVTTGVGTVRRPAPTID